MTANSLDQIHQAIDETENVVVGQRGLIQKVRPRARLFRCLPGTLVGCAGAGKREIQDNFANLLRRSLYLTRCQDKPE